MGKEYNINASLKREITKFSSQVHVARVLLSTYLLRLKGEDLCKNVLVKLKLMKTSSYHLKEAKRFSNRENQ